MPIQKAIDHQAQNCPVCESEPLTSEDGNFACCSIPHCYLHQSLDAYGYKPLDENTKLIQIPLGVWNRLRFMPYNEPVKRICLDDSGSGFHYRKQGAFTKYDKWMDMRNEKT